VAKISCKKLQFIALKNWGCASNPATYIHNFPISDAVIKVLKRKSDQWAMTLL